MNIKNPALKKSFITLLLLFALTALCWGEGIEKIQIKQKHFGEEKLLYEIEFPYPLISCKGGKLHIYINEKEYIEKLEKEKDMEIPTPKFVPYHKENIIDNEELEKLMPPNKEEKDEMECEACGLSGGFHNRDCLKLHNEPRRGEQ